MNIEVPKGRYVLAISGGVDSMVLLDVLRRQPGVELVAAHFNHGIRKGATLDEALVDKAAKEYGLQFEVGYGKLGSRTSEDQARQARYAFLRAVKEKHGAKAIITAHHQDDLIETALLNMLRGTGAKGLASIGTSKGILRPMLHIPKKEVLNYAKQHKIRWREDPSNNDIRFLRNYIRHRLTSSLTENKRVELLNNIDKVAKIRKLIEPLIATISHNIRRAGYIDRSLFAQLPSEVADELIVYWLRQKYASDIDRKTVHRLHLVLKTAAAGSRHPVKKNLVMQVDKRRAYFTTSV